jgi:hypothetical protein
LRLLKPGECGGIGIFGADFSSSFSKTDRDGNFIVGSDVDFSPKKFRSNGELPEMILTLDFFVTDVAAK